MKTLHTFLVLSGILSGCLPGPLVVIARGSDGGTDAAMTNSDGTTSNDVANDANTADGERRDEAAPDAGSSDVAASDSNSMVLDAQAADGETWTVRVLDAGVGDCAPGQWCWEHALPTAEPIWAATATSANDVWAFGSFGTALRFDGTQWIRTQTNTRGDIRSAYASSPNDVWVSVWDRDASGGYIAFSMQRWNGTRWSPVTLPPGMTPRFVTGTSANDVWLLGVPSSPGSSTTVFWRFDGTQWNAVPTTGLPSAGVRTDSIWIEAPGRAWMYAAAPGAAHSYQLYRFANNQWTQVVDLGRFLPNYAFTGTIAGSNGEAYALVRGPEGGVSNYIVAGTAPRVVPLPGNDANSVSGFVSAGGALWLLAAGLYRRDGTTWTPITIPRPNIRVQSPLVFAGTAAQNMWGFNTTGDIFRSQAGSWSLYTSSNKPSFSTLSQHRTGGILAAGTHVYQRNATGQWTQTMSTFPTVSQLVRDAASGTIRYLLSDGKCFQAGASLVDLTPSGERVQSLSMSSNGTLWMRTERRIARLDGSRWVNAPPLPERIGTIQTSRFEFQQLWADDNEVWIGGGERLIELENDINGAVCRLRGDSWTCIQLSTERFANPSPVNALWGTRNSLWMLVGYSLERIERDTFTRTKIVFSGTDRSFYSLRGNDQTGDLLVNGGPTFVLHPGTRGNERIAEQLQRPTSEYTSRLDFFLSDDGSVFGVGPLGEILRYQPTNPM